MSISIYKIKKWTRMLTGNSISHVRQGVGKIFSKNKIEGYYNDLTEKVTKRSIQANTLPKSQVDNGDVIYFSIEIFQYGLGAYDLYLMNGDKNMLDKAIACADWAVDNQQDNGGWVTFLYENSTHPYSSMAQGEGISLLVRVYIATSIERYREAAEKAKIFMLIPIEAGGTTKYDDNDVYLYECTHDPLILNGWIFSLWGLIDYCKLTQNTQAQSVLSASLSTLEKRLADFDIGYWSMYEDDKRISSPFYHKLHIAQLRAMYDLTGSVIYKEYGDRWEKYQNNVWYLVKAFVIKAMQKIIE